MTAEDGRFPILADDRMWISPFDIQISDTNSKHKKYYMNMDV
jgi:hypothetical protein